MNAVVCPAQYIVIFLMDFTQESKQANWQLLIVERKPLIDNLPIALDVKTVMKMF